MFVCTAHISLLKSSVLFLVVGGGCLLPSSPGGDKTVNSLINWGVFVVGQPVSSSGRPRALIGRRRCWLKPRRKERSRPAATRPPVVGLEHRVPVDQRRLALPRSSVSETEWGWCCFAAPGRTNAWERRKVRRCGAARLAVCSRRGGRCVRKTHGDAHQSGNKGSCFALFIIFFVLLEVWGRDVKCCRVICRKLQALRTCKAMASSKWCVHCLHAGGHPSSTLTANLMFKEHFIWIKSTKQQNTGFTLNLSLNNNTVQKFQTFLLLVILSKSSSFMKALCFFYIH